MKRASALLKNGKVLLQGYSQTTSGVWIARGPVYVANVVQTSEIGRNILHALNESTRGVPHPKQTEWKAVQAPMLQAAGAKPWAALKSEFSAKNLGERLVEAFNACG